MSVYGVVCVCIACVCVLCVDGCFCKHPNRTQILKRFYKINNLHKTGQFGQTMADLYQNAANTRL